MEILNRYIVPESYAKDVSKTLGLPYLQNPDKKPMTEAEKRWLSWNFLVRSKIKGQYSGTVPEKVKAKRRAKNKVAKASRKVNR